MKKAKLLTGAVAVYLLSSAAAYAEFNVNLNVGEPAYIAPAPVVVQPSPAYVVAPWTDTYDPHHRRHNWRYWHDHDHR